MGETNGERIRQCLADPAGAIKLENLVNPLISKSVHALDPGRFPLDHQDSSPTGLRERIDAYWDATEPLLEACILLGRWGRDEHAALLRQVIGHLLGRVKQHGGYLVWLDLQWYPLTLLYYASGIAAISADNWGILRELYRMDPVPLAGSSESRAVAEWVSSGMNCHGEGRLAFKAIPEVAEKRYPMSEALFEQLRGPIDGSLFLGDLAYETTFDRFEVFHTLQWAVNGEGEEPRRGGPGRFAWKVSHQGDPMVDFDRYLRQISDSHPLFTVGAFTLGRERILGALTQYRDFVLGGRFR